MSYPDPFLPTQSSLLSLSDDIPAVASASNVDPTPNHETLALHRSSSSTNHTESQDNGGDSTADGENSHDNVTATNTTSSSSPLPSSSFPDPDNNGDSGRKIHHDQHRQRGATQQQQFSGTQGAGERDESAPGAVGGVGESGAGEEGDGQAEGVKQKWEEKERQKLEKAMREMGRELGTVGLSDSDE